MEIARSIGGNWIWYIHYNIFDKDTVIIDREYRVHKNDDIHPIITTTKEYRVEEANSDIPILILGFGITRKEYLVLKTKTE